MNSKKNYIQKFIQWINITTVTYVLIVIIRIVEWNLLSSEYSLSDNLWKWQLSGLIHDFFTVSLFSFGLGIIYFFVSLMNTKFSKFISVSALVLLLIFQLLFIFYFVESLTPLSVSDIKGMSHKQVEFITDIYGFKFVYLLGLIPLVLILYVAFNQLLKLINYKYIRTATVVIFCLSIVIQTFKPVKENAFDSELNYHVVVNKLYFFIDSYFVYLNDSSEELKDIQASINLYYKQQNISKTEYLDYPFFVEEEVKDVLSPFFEKKNISPNIVFIISESLGKQYSGKDAPLGSFTPFLDSLANHSLYWSNVIANAERTFGSIPNLMTGLPESKRGFMNMRWNMPDHLSLPLLLKENNNYQTAFYCGAWKYFDNMADYVMFQKFDHVLGKKEFKPNHINHKLTKGVDEFEIQNWGAEDYQVFKESIEFMEDNFDKQKPFLNLYLSTSFHKPYAYTNQNYFENLAKQIIKSKVSINNQSKHLKHLSDFAALLYADYSMQQVFEMYKKAGLFENTIFVIIGDHSLKFMNDNPRLEKFHVPLLIYSPLLKRSKRINSVVCQKDVPSAIQALLKNTYNLQLPSFSISQTNNLDTLKDLTFKSEFAMMYSNKRLTNYVENDILLSDNMLFKIKNNLLIDGYNDSEKLKKLQLKLSTYKRLNNYVCSQNRLIPKTIVEQYSPINYQLNYSNDFTLTKPSNFNKQVFSINEYYSAPKSIEVKNNLYISLLDSQKIDLTTRVRVLVKYKILSPSGYIPSLVFLEANKIKSQKPKITTVFLHKNNDYIQAIPSSNWKTVEADYWIEKGESIQLQVYLFNSEKEKLFIDDFHIEIRNF